MLVRAELNVKADAKARLAPTLLILAAGRSTRYGHPKALVPVGPSGETLIDYAILDSQREGFGEAVIVTQPELHEAIARHAHAVWPTVTIRFLFQEIEDVPPHEGKIRSRRKPWGTGHAVLSARHAVTRPFVVVNCDDFYGRVAYQLAAAHLRSDEPSSAMVGYQLRDTLSPSGGVSRAICQVDARQGLTDLKEVLDIEAMDENLKGRTPDGQTVTLTGNEIVSMNFWAFQTTVFALLEHEFARFLSSVSGSMEPEFYLSEAVGNLTREGRLSVRVLTAPGSWIGITRPEDLEPARSTLRGLTDTGVYPSDIASTTGEG